MPVEIYINRVKKLENLFYSILSSLNSNPNSVIDNHDYKKYIYLKDNVVIYHGVIIFFTLHAIFLGFCFSYYYYKILFICLIFVVLIGIN